MHQPRTLRRDVAPSGGPVSNDDRDSYLYLMMRDGSEPGVLDIGHDVRIMFTVRVIDGRRVGLVESHPSPEGYGCGGALTFDVPEADGLAGPRWTVESWEPLTISPSVRCSCGWHGFIREGRWCPV